MIGREFPLVRPEYGVHIRARAQHDVQLTTENVGLVQVFVVELASARNIGVGRGNEITFALTTTSRRYHA